MKKKLEIKNPIGKNIRKMIDYRGFQKQYVAKKIGTRADTLSRIMNDEYCNPNGIFVHEIAKILMVRTGDLFEEGYIDKYINDEINRGE